MSTDKKKKTYDHFEIIGEVRGVLDKDDRITLTIKESTGKEFDWKAFHASPFRGKVENGKIYHFKVTHAHEEGRQYPYRNLEELIGPAEMPSSGEMTSYRTPGGGAAGSPTAPRANSGGNFTPEAKIIERKSIEASQALMIQVDLLKAGFKIEDIPDVLDKMIENAKAVTTYYEGHRPELVAPAATPLTAPVSEATPNEKTAKLPTKIGHIGHFLTYCLNKHNFTRANVEDIVGALEGVETWGELVKQVDQEAANRMADMAKAVEAA